MAGIVISIQGPALGGWLSVDLGFDRESLLLFPSKCCCCSWTFSHQPLATGGNTGRIIIPLSKSRKGRDWLGLAEATWPFGLGT